MVAIRLSNLAAVPAHVEETKRQIDFDDSLVQTVIRTLRRCRYVDPDLIERARAKLAKFIKEHVDPQIQRIVADQNFNLDKTSLYHLPSHKEFGKPVDAFQFLSPATFKEAQLDELIYKICSAVYTHDSDALFKAICVRHFLEMAFWIRFEPLISGNGPLAPVTVRLTP